MSDEDEWTPHDGSACPVHPDTLVFVKMRDGRTDVELYPSPASYWIPSDDADANEWVDDITHYRVVTR